MIKIMSPDGKLMDAKELATWANTVHQITGGKGSPFTSKMFIPHNDCVDRFRLSGHHCNCGCDENAVGKPTKGKFKLLPFYSPDVKEGGKAYMQCQVCGEFSHL